MLNTRYADKETFFVGLSTLFEGSCTAFVNADTLFEASCKIHFAFTTFSLRALREMGFVSRGDR